MMTGTADYSLKRVEEAMEKYEGLRQRLKDIPVMELGGYEGFKELLGLQDYLVRVVIERNEIGGLAGRVRELIRPSDSDLRKYPLYSVLAEERDTRSANYLRGRQK